MTKRAGAVLLKEFFGVPGKPITNKELIQLRKEDKDGYDELVALVREFLDE